jgi:hypothetical protein
VSRNLSRGVLVFVLLAAVVVGSIWGYRSYKSLGSEEKRLQDTDKESLIRWAQASRFGSEQWRDQIASDFLGEKATTGPCEWLFVQTWHGSTKNPNWVSIRKGSDGANLICKAYANDRYRSAMWFEYDFEDGRGIVGLRWGYWTDD